jgi:copper(I)-binding protein
MLPVVAASLACLALVACKPAAEPAAQTTQAPGVSVSEPRLVLPIIAGDPAATYFTASNGSDKPASITSVEVEGAGMVMMHDTITEGGKTGMAMMESVAIPPHGSVTFAPGGKHVMVSGLSDQIKAGAKSKITLILADGAKVQAGLPVESATSGQ